MTLRHCEEISVWDLLVGENKLLTKAKDDTKAAEDPELPRHTTLLFVGDRGSGKTTLLQHFLGGVETPRRTLAMEYTFGRKQSKKEDKDVCHLWELGGGTIFTSLLSTPLNHHTILTLAVFLVLDLSRLDTLWTHMEVLLNEIKDRITVLENSPSGQALKLKKKLHEAASKRFGEHHQDNVFVSAFPVPLTIIGGKYDQFKTFEPVSRRLVCRSLRFVAHINGANLVYFSAQDEELVKITKEIMTHYAFGSRQTKGFFRESNEPLLILCGEDTFQSIQGSSGDFDAYNTSYDNWKQAYKAQFPQEADKKGPSPIDPSKDVYFYEPEVDNLKLQKDMELDQMREQITRYSLHELTL